MIRQIGAAFIRAYSFGTKTLDLPTKVMTSHAPILPHGSRRVKSLTLFSPVSPNRLPARGTPVTAPALGRNGPREESGHERREAGRKGTSQFAGPQFKTSPVIPVPEPNSGRSRSRLVYPVCP